MTVAVRWRAAILALGALLLAVVALGSRGSPEIPLPTPGPAWQTALDGFLWSAAVALLVLGLVGLVLRATGRGRRTPRARAPFHVRMLVIIGVVALFLAGALVFFVLGQSAARKKPVASTTSTPGSNGGFSLPGHTAGVPFPWLGLLAGVAVILAAMAVAVVLLARSRVRVPAAEADGPEEPPAPVLAVDAAIDALDGEIDPRRAVIAAYTTMERLLGAAGSPRRIADAPTEHLERSLVLLGAGRSAARRLTDLFERARFSRHDIDENLREAALAALTAVRHDLEPA